MDRTLGPKISATVSPATNATDTTKMQRVRGAISAFRLEVSRKTNMSKCQNQIGVLIVTCQLCRVHTVSADSRYYAISRRSVA